MTLLKRTLLAALVACSALPASAAPNYPALAAAAIQERLVDPMSIQRAQRTPPFEHRMWGTHVAICARFYAKNRAGGYGGITVWTVVFREKRGILVMPDTNVCGDRYEWTPFPELTAN